MSRKSTLVVLSSEVRGKLSCSCPCHCSPPPFSACSSSTYVFQGQRDLVGMVVHFANPLLKPQVMYNDLNCNSKCPSPTALGSKGPGFDSLSWVKKYALNGQMSSKLNMVVLLSKVQGKLSGSGLCYCAPLPFSPCNGSMHIFQGWWNLVGMAAHFAHPF